MTEPLPSIDKRKIGRQAQQSMRISVVQRVLDGESPEELARTLDVARSAIYRWVKSYREGGLEALREKKAPGRAKLLSDDQLEFIRYIVVSTSPPFWSFPTVMWTRAMVAELVERVFGLSYSVEGIGRLMRHEMKLSNQRPVRRAYEQDEKKVRQWLIERYPAIKAKADKSGATIFFADEAGVRSDYHSGKTWSPVGKTPVVETTGQRFGMNVISALSATGELRYMEVDGRMNAEKFIVFLRRLIAGRDEPVFLIVDGHPTHKAKKVAKFLDAKDIKGRLELFILPPYSPQLNPDELVWNHLKNHGSGKSPFKSIVELKRWVHARMKSMQKMPALVRSFFGEAHVQYAA